MPAQPAPPPGTPLPDAFERRFAAFVRAFGLLDAERTPCGARLPISEAHALTVLADEGALTQQRLGEALGLAKSTVSRLVDQLEGRGWVQRRVSQRDARYRLLELTEAGRRVADDVTERRRVRLSQLLARVPEAERASVVQALTTLTEATRDLDQL